MTENTGEDGGEGGWLGIRDRPGFWADVCSPHVTKHDSQYRECGGLGNDLVVVTGQTDSSKPTMSCEALAPG